MVVWPVEIHEQLTQAPQQPQRAGRSIEELPSGARGGNGTLQQQAALFTRFDARFLQKPGNAWILNSLKDSFHETGFLTGTDQCAVRPLPQQKLESANEHALPCTRLAGNGGKSRLRFPEQIINQRKVSDA